jgi:hypothetical protein
VEVESTVTLASDREEVEGLVRRIALLEGALAEVHQAQEMAEENSCGLSDAAADAERRPRRREESEKELQEELTLLQTRAPSRVLP